MTGVASPLAAAGFATEEQMLSSLGVSKETLARWETEEGLPFSLVGRSHFYDLELFREWLQKKRKRPRTKAQRRQAA